MSSYRLDAFWSPNKNAGDYEKVGFTIHHAATTDFDGIGRTFQSPARQASAHYGVEPGHVQQYVEDPYVAWHAGDSWANAHTIGIECVNSGGEADGWPVAEETIDTLVEFMADKCRELGIGELSVGENLFGHRDFSATFCPGVLYARLGEISSVDSPVVYRIHRYLVAQQNAPRCLVKTAVDVKTLFLVHNRATDDLLDRFFIYRIRVVCGHNVILFHEDNTVGALQPLFALVERGKRSLFQHRIQVAVYRAYCLGHVHNENRTVGK